MDKELIKNKLTKQLLNLTQKYPDLKKYNLAGNKLGNFIFRTDPVRYAVLLSNNPVLKYNRYKNILEELESVAEGNLITFLKSFDLYHHVREIRKSK